MPKSITIAVAGLLGLSAAVVVVTPVVAAKHHHNRFYGRHHAVQRFGGSDPDNIGIYGGADYGFFGGPNGETTYHY